MKTTINRDKTYNTFVNASITDIDITEYTSIILYLRRTKEHIEMQIKECKSKKHLKQYIPNRQEELQQLKELIEKLQN